MTIPIEYLLELQKKHYKEITPLMLKKEREISREEAKLRLLKEYKKEATSEELKHIIEEFKNQEKKSKKVKTPTEYEDPVTYSLIQKLSSIIKSGRLNCHVIHQESGHIVKITEQNYNFSIPSFGTIDFGNINAVTYPCGNNQYLIIFQKEFTTFCYLLCKIIAQIFPIYDSRKGIEDYKKEVEKNIGKKPEITKRFRELIIAYTSTGKATNAPPYVISIKYNNFLSDLTLAMEVFAMAHEYAHIMNNHLSEQNFTQTNNISKPAQMFYRQQQEYEADHLALSLALQGLSNEGKKNDFINYAGIESFFSALEIFERAKCILKVGDDKWYWKKGGVSSGEDMEHPPIDERKEKLRNQAKFSYNEKFVDGGIITEYIFKTLFEKMKPELVKEHEKRKKVEN